jgi:uncharacterized protein (TIGR03435 family)
VYDVQKASVVGGPDWLDKPVYDIVAHASTAVKSDDDMRPLVEAMLVDQFGLQAHPDVRQVPAFVLRVDEGGSKLTSYTPETAHRIQMWKKDADHVVYVGNYISLEELTRQISELMNRPVLDQTGLASHYDFWLVGSDRPQALPAELREQLGLQLAAVTAPINVIVVDDVHEPTVDVQPATASGAKIPASALASHAAARRAL